MAMGDKVESRLRLWRRGAYLLLAGVLAAAVSLAAGCGGGGKTTSTSARRSHVVNVTQVSRDRWAYARARFRETCIGCHTLADAGAHGRRFNLDMVGPISTQLARHAIEFGEPGMPSWKGVLSRRELEELVAYVTSVTKNTGEGSGETGWHWQIELRMEGEGPPSTWRR
jgi:mono/diheme cytochrome c family protein